MKNVASGNEKCIYVNGEAFAKLFFIFVLNLNLILKMASRRYFLLNFIAGFPLTVDDTMSVPYLHIVYS